MRATALLWARMGAVNIAAAVARGRLTAPLATLIVCACLAAGCGHVNYDYKSEPDPRTTEFVVGPLDELSIVVWKNRDLSADVSVRPDGVLTLPLIGDIKAAGRTPTELKQELTKRFADFIHTDETVITVAVKSVNSYHYTISGNVERPGLFNGKSYLTVVEALATAGGLNRFAGNIVYLLRKNQGGASVRRIPFDVRRITSAEHSNENLVVLAGDVMVVP